MPNKFIKSFFHKDTLPNSFVFLFLTILSKRWLAPSCSHATVFANIPCTIPNERKRGNPCEKGHRSSVLPLPISELSLEQVLLLDKRFCNFYALRMDSFINDRFIHHSVYMDWHKTYANGSYIESHVLWGFEPGHFGPKMRIGSACLPWSCCSELQPSCLPVAARYLRSSFICLIRLDFWSPWYFLISYYREELEPLWQSTRLSFLLCCF